MANETAKMMQEDLEAMVKDARPSADFTAEADEALAKAENLVKAGRTDEALEELFAVEKKARVASDSASATRLVKAVLHIFYDKKDLPKLNETILLIAKKRSQLKKVILDMVQLAMGWLDKLEREAQYDLLKTLGLVTEGRIFVEVEGARLSLKHAKMLEADGKPEEAANLLQEVQVETCGTMERREKAEYILEQMRLVLQKKDFVRLQIISRKINPKLIDAEDFQDIKLTYYDYVIKLHLHEAKYLDVAKSYYALYGTKIVQDDEPKWKDNLECYILYLVTAPYDNEAVDLLNKVDAIEKKKLEKIPVFNDLVKSFLTTEIIPWPLASEKDLKAHKVFSDSPHPGGATRWEKFHKRVVQHNLKVVSTYYTRINMSRLSEMLNLPVDELEQATSDFVTSKFLYARIDRPAGILTFGAKKTAEERLNGYQADINKLLNLIEDSCHLIQKENMVHAARKESEKAQAKAAAKRK
jgi:26S proteasome regulatory subunit N5